jgi:hypothetical protein
MHTTINQINERPTALGRVSPVSTVAAGRTRQSARPCTVVVGRVDASEIRDARGETLYALELTVLGEGRAAYRARIGAAVPADGVRLLSPGNALPAWFVPGSQDGELEIDWPMAIGREARAA